MNIPVGIRSLTVCFPEIIRTQDDWLQKFPNLTDKVNLRKARLSRSAASTYGNQELDIWSQEVALYLSDPFRGNVEQRVLGSDESPLMLEYQAAKEALEAAKLTPQDVELLIVASFYPGQIGPGNACYLVHQLGLCCPAWNLESTCSSALIALQNANALLQIGTYQNVLVVVSHIGSKNVDEEDTLSWSMGDGAGAFVVDALKPNQGILGTKIVHTSATRNAYSYEHTINTQGKPQILTRTGENASALAETAVDFVRVCCKGAVAAAGVTLEQIDFFAFNTPTAWYASVCTRALDVDPKRTIDLYPRYANIGPVLPIANLYHAAQAGKICENDLVLVYTNGAAATAAATVMRWGDVALGTIPAPPITTRDTSVQLQQLEQSDRVEQKLSRTKILAVTTEKREQIIKNYLIAWLSSSLQLLPQEIDPDQSLTMWLDSLMAFSLRSRIEADLKIRISIENFFGDNNLTNLTQLILDRLTLSNLVISQSVDSGRESERERLSL